MSHASVDDDAPVDIEGHRSTTRTASSQAIAFQLVLDRAGFVYE